jgi:hypothetical protein
VSAEGCVAIGAVCGPAYRAFLFRSSNVGPALSLYRGPVTASLARRCHSYGIAGPALSFDPVEETASGGHRCRWLGDDSRPGTEIADRLDLGKFWLI